MKPIISPPRTPPTHSKQWRAWAVTLAAVLVMLVVTALGFVLLVGPVVTRMATEKLSPQPPQEAVAIASVYSQARWIAEAAYDKKSFVVELRKIDVSKCPQDFRLAWMDFIHASERENDRGLLDALQFGFDSLLALHGDARHASQSLRELNSLRDASQTLERVAVKYGVK